MHEGERTQFQFNKNQSLWILTNKNLKSLRKFPIKIQLCKTMRYQTLGQTPLQMKEQKYQSIARQRIDTPLISGSQVIGSEWRYFGKL